MSNSPHLSAKEDASQALRRWGMRGSISRSRISVLLPSLVWAATAALTSFAVARDTIRGSSTGSSSAQGTAALSASSQTATAATAATAQAAQAVVTARRSQDSFVHAASAFQAAKAAQASAAAVALSGANHLVGTTDVTDGLGLGGLNPAGDGGVSTTGSAIQIIQLAPGSKNQLALGSSGSVTLPNGTPGADQITITGAGSVTTTGGHVTTSAGSLTTTTGGTLVATNGGSISLTAGSDVLTTTTSTVLSSTLAATVTLPGGSGTVTLAANTSSTIPAGSSISFTGTSAGTVTVSGAATVALSGAGTLALSNSTSAGAGGTVTTSSGTTSFTNGGSLSSLASGSQINVVGSATVALTGTTDGSAAATLPIVIPATSSFTTTGTELTTVAHNFAGWTSGVSALSQSTGDGLTTVTVTQSSPEALLNWTTFNIGKNTLLDFDQSAGGASVGTWVAVNQIQDPSLAPSQILGRIEASGQVYVINQNGIIFGGSSQVNVHALTASSLPLNSNLTSPEELLGGATTDDQFLFSQLTVAQVQGVTGALPEFDPPAAPAGGDGDVVVQPGASLTSPTTAEHVGGRIALIGPVVDNEGTISTPDGQTILAAGLQVGFTAHAQSDPSLRGLDVFVGQVVGPDGITADASGTLFGTATNGGVIDSPRADITLAGMNVNQNGMINSLTSVALNGRIDLLADYGASPTIFQVNGVNQALYSPTLTGNVTFGLYSVTQILPDSTGATVVGTALALPSLVNVEGLNINMMTGAELLAPGATATAPTISAGGVETSVGSVDLAGAAITSGVSFSAGTWNGARGLASAALSFTSGQINIDSGATIDVSGSQNVSASASEYIIPVELRGSELADSPLQQAGALRGQTVDVDIRQSGVYDGVAWIGSPIGDLSGYAALVQHTVNELTVNGGTVGLQAGSAVNLAATSTVNVSGGSISYQSTNVQTTQVVTSDGRILDISQATPDQVYQGIYQGFTQTSSKWGVSETFNNPLENTTTTTPGYIQGGSAGALTISTPLLGLQGNLYGNTIAGANQIEASRQVSIQTGGKATEIAGLSQFAGATFNGSNFLPILQGIDAVPQSGTFVLNLFSQSTTGGQASTVPQDIVFQPSTGVKSIDPYAATGNSELDLSTDLIDLDGFGKLTIDGNSPVGDDYNATSLQTAISIAGSITVPTGSALTLAPGGSLTMASVNMDIEDSIFAPGGQIRLSTQNVIASQVVGSSSPVAPIAGRGDFVLGADATLSTAGLIVNNSANSPDANTLPQVTTGGSIAIKSLNANLQAGSTIDASGGVLLDTKGSASYGAGGSIDIEVGQDPYLDASTNYGVLGGSIFLGSTLSAYSGGTGGSLSITAPAIQIGGSQLDNGDTSGTPVQQSPLIWSNGTTVWLDKTGASDFFSQGGFSSFTLSGLGLAPIVYASNGVAAVNEPYQSTPGVLIASGTPVHPVAKQYHEAVDADGVDLTPEVNPLASQRSPVNLSFQALGVTATGLTSAVLISRGDLVMQAGSVITTDPLASVSLTGQSVAILGQIFAPGGVISVTGAKDSTNLFQANQSGVDGESDIVATVDLGPESILSTAGTAEQTFNPLGFDTGTVLNGGTVSVSGNIVAETGSLIDVSGASGTFDVLPAAAGLSLSGFGTPQMVPLMETSNGGSIAFKGGEELFIDSTLVGGAGGLRAQPGSLTITGGFSNYNTVNASTVPTQAQIDANLIVTQGGPTRADALTGLAVIGQMVTPSHPTLDVDGNPILSYFSANSNLFSNVAVTGAQNNGGVAGGIGSLTLNGTVQFLGPVSISASTSLVVGNNPASSNALILYGGYIYADSTVQLNSAYVRLGLPFVGPSETVTPAAPVSGAGSLTVNSSTLTDIGDLSFENIDQLAVNSAGDIRGDGALNVAGNILLSAAQIYPTTESTFTIAAYGSSSVTISEAAVGIPSLPLSAGGVLNIYADTITQGGVLRAPMGIINLGTLNPPAGSSLPVTNQITLSSGSITSVSAVDPSTGLGIIIPYGTVDANGNWIDPAGHTITAGSNPTLPAKAINIAGANISDLSGSTLDIQGGGDLIASQFISGTGGTNDILASTSSFAVLPSSSTAFAPFDTDSSYATASYGHLQIGDQVYLQGGSGLAAGIYTLLPAGYALLPGAFLVTPKSGALVGSAVTQLDGSSLVSGYRLSSLNGDSEQSTFTAFQVASRTVINSEAQYTVDSANIYFPGNASTLAVATPRLPNDAGQLLLNATQSLMLPNAAGTLLAQPGTGGLGSIVDISSPTAINIYHADNPATSIVGDLNLDAGALNSFGADSLLIGGFRTVTSTGTQVTVSTSSVTVDNAGAALIGPDITLVSNGTLTLAAGAAIESTPGSSVTAPLLQLTGDGAAVRVSSDSSAQIIRSGVTANTSGPDLAIGADAVIGSTDGSGCVILDSTSAASLDAQAILGAHSVSLNAGQISIVLPNLDSPITTPLTGLVLSDETLGNLQSTAQNFSLLSYSSLDFWGSGDIGASADASGVYAVKSLALHTPEIRGFDNGGGAVTINAQSVVLDNSANGTALGPVAGSGTTGTFAINAQTLTLGNGALAIDQFAQVTLSASASIILANGTGSLATAGDLALATPLLTAAPIVPLTATQELNGQAQPKATVETITATGQLTMTNPGSATAISEGLGANLTLSGTQVTMNSNVQLPSGSLNIVATTGNLAVGGNLDVSGISENIYDLTEYTSGGQISLNSYAGGVTLNAGSTVNVSAQSGGGNAGSLTISALQGSFAFAGSSMLGQGGSGGQGGTFSLATGSLGGSSLSPLEAALNPVVTGAIAGDTYLGGFTHAQTIRVKNGDLTIDGITATDSFNVSTDTDSITVTGKIAGNSGSTDANGLATANIDVTTTTDTNGNTILANPGFNGGTVDLEANGSVTIASGALLSVAAQTVNDAGQGGTIDLEAGSESNGVEVSTSQSRDGTTGRFSGVPVVDIQTGSVLDLSVAATTKMFDGSEIVGTTGTLQLRAPQTSSNTDVQIDPINGTILNTSSLVVEGYQVFSATDGSIDNQEAAVMDNGNMFVGAAGQPATDSYTSMLNALVSATGPNNALQALTTIEPGAEIINTAGDLTLAGNWDLSTYRFGPNNTAGDLTLRSSGNLVFDFGASLSDGFTTNPSFPTLGLWGAVLMPVGSQSWSYRLVAGGDLSAADYRQVLPMTSANSLVPAAPNALTANSGSVVLGLGALALPQSSPSLALTTQQVMVNDGYYQTIRTGAGSIDIETGRDVQLLNSVATIYTAGTQSAPLTGFAVPKLTHPRVAGNSSYNLPGTRGTIANAQYSQDGGNLTINAQGDVAHYTLWSNSSGQSIVGYDINGNPLMADSSSELPTNWLYRRGFANGDTFAIDSNNQVASTTWWIDFNNFFEGVGALGGGNVVVQAGGSINNVDAVVPTNARMPGTDASGNLIAPSAANLVESGGGDLYVSAGGDINGGVYYVERGQGVLDAGDNITTNATRTVAIGLPVTPSTYLPTTLFLGKGDFSLSAGGDLLLGPIANPFLLPQGINNTVDDKSYFSTYSTSDVITAFSLTGSTTIKDSAPSNILDSILLDFYADQASAGAPTNSFSYSEPWVGLTETNIDSFDAAFRLMPPTLKVTALSGDINLVGNLTLSPSPDGTLDLVAGGALNGFQPVSSGPTGIVSWASSQINLSDANPNSIPGIASPLSYVANPALQISLNSTDTALFTSFDNLFAESGSTTGIYAELTTQQALHASLPIDPTNPNSVLGPLHAADATPVHLYAQNGGIDGVDLFAGKLADVVAGNDISNVSFYIQNVNATDITLVESGQDIIAYDPNSVLREEAHARGGIYLGENDDITNLSTYLPLGGGAGAPNAGDIQIAGPGTVEVLAGHNLELGNGPSNGDGTGLGIVSIGNTVDPYLTTFAGADIIAGAGLSGLSQTGSSGATAAFGLDPTHNSSLDFSAFTAQFLNPSSGGDEAARYLPDLAALLGTTDVTNNQVWDIFSGTSDATLTAQEKTLQAQLTPERRDALAMTIFYDVLRDAGRDHNTAGSPNVGTYAEGYAALAALFPFSNSYQGDISLTAREIKTTNGGNISLLAPGGGVDVGLNNSGTQAIDQGILTVDGGNISIFAQNDVAVGTSRIFTLHGGDEIIWSTLGNIDAGASSKTVQSAPPTRVLIDTQSGNVETDLAGLATGGGIGVLETIAGAPPGNVDLIAPSGIVDAGDAGIRSSGNINISAAQILNAGNIQSSGSTSGVSTASTPNIGATVAASAAGGASQNAAADAARQQQNNQPQPEVLPSIISVQVIGYGGGDNDSASTDSTPTAQPGTPQGAG